MNTMSLSCPSQIAVQSGLIRKSVHVTSFRAAFLSGQSRIPDKLFTSPSYDPLYKLGVNVRVRAQAYESGKSDGIPDGPIEPKEVVTAEPAGWKLKIGVYFVTWWALNVVFNIYNKKVLNAFPYPWLTSTLSLAAGSLIMLASWITRIAETPDVDLDFWKALAPVKSTFI